VREREEEEEEEKERREFQRFISKSLALFLGSETQLISASFLNQN